MTRPPTSNYQRQLALAAQTLCTHQNHDGGWGVKFGAASTIVNTAEALRVLWFAGLGWRSEPVQHAVGFLRDHIHAHCRPAELGGNGGEWPRYVSYGLQGLCQYAEALQSVKNVAEIRWCIDWLESQRCSEGWADVGGEGDMSPHQTALVVRAVAQTLTQFTAAPQYSIGLSSERWRQRCRSLIEHGVGGLLLYARADGSWAWRTYNVIGASPATTALCALAFNAAADHLPEDARFAAGDPAAGPFYTVRSHASRGAVWLHRNADRWQQSIELDPGVQGEVWQHVTYALGLEAVASCNVPPGHPALRRAVNRLNEQWSEKDGVWTEFAAPSPLVTIRGLQAAVSAYEAMHAALERLATPTDLTIGAIEQPADVIGIDEVSFVESSGLLTLHMTDGHSYEVDITAALRASLSLIMASTGFTKDDIARRLCLSPTSIPTHVSRLNTQVSKATAGAVTKFVINRNECSRNVYRLNLSDDARVDFIGTAPDDMSSAVTAS